MLSEERRVKVQGKGESYKDAKKKKKVELHIFCIHRYNDETVDLKYDVDTYLFLIFSSFRSFII